MPDIPKLGLATGFGMIGFGVAYVVTGMWFDQDIYLDIAIGAIVAAVAWVIMVATGWGKE